MNRRRFLEYAGATAAVVGASALGLNYISSKNPLAVPPTASTTTTRALTTSSSSFTSSTHLASLTSLGGRLFFDYNGSGTREEMEPPIGATVQLWNMSNGLVAEAVTDSQGEYYVADLPSGDYRLHLLADPLFRYATTTADVLQPASKPFPLRLDSSTRLGIGLVHGFLTLPFAPSAREYRPRQYFDADRRTGEMKRTWKGAGQTYDQHSGTDFYLPMRTPIAAAAPGQVVCSGYDERAGNLVCVAHQDAIRSHYIHLDSRAVEQGDFVDRGQTIGKSGRTGTGAGDHPHLHFMLCREGEACSPTAGVDAYKDVLNPSSVGWWTFENNPQYALEYF